MTQKCVGRSATDVGVNKVWCWGTMLVHVEFVSVTMDSNMTFTIIMCLNRYLREVRMI